MGRLKYESRDNEPSNGTKFRFATQAHQPGNQTKLTYSLVEPKDFHGWLKFVDFVVLSPCNNNMTVQSYATPKDLRTNYEIRHVT